MCFEENNQKSCQRLLEEKIKSLWECLEDESGGREEAGRRLTKSTQHTFGLILILGRI